MVNTVHGLYALPDDPFVRRVAVYGMERVAATCSDAELMQNEEDLGDVAPPAHPEPDASRCSATASTCSGSTRTGSTPIDRARARRELGAADDNEVVVGTVGRLVVEKGYRELFAAAAAPARRRSRRRDRVRRARQGRRGDGRRDRATHPDDGVHFLGGRADVDWLYAGMDVFVLASHREGFPRTPMEAAAMGLPVVATDIRGCRQVVEHGSPVCSSRPTTRQRWQPPSGGW